MFDYLLLVYRVCLFYMCTMWPFWLLPKHKLKNIWKCGIFILIFVDLLLVILALSGILCNFALKTLLIMHKSPL